MKKVKDFLMQNYKRIIGIILVIAVAFGGYFGVKAINERLLEKKVEDIDWLRGNIELVKDSSMGKNIYKIYKNDNISIFNLKYQQIVKEKIEELFSTSENHLIVYNPYGTNKLSFNIYFSEVIDDSIEYTVSVDNEDIVYFSR